MLSPFKYVSIAKNITCAIAGYVAVKYAIENTSYIPQLQTIIMANPTATLLVTKIGTFVSNVVPNVVFPNLFEIIPVLGAVASYKIASSL